jgi:predicted enzyme related to lactoylglutathione lyase
MNTNRNPVGWFEIYVQDMERAKTFYQNTFQATLERLESPDIELWVFPNTMGPDNPGCAGALVKMDGKDSGAGGTLVYFSCEDCAVEATRAVKYGGRVQKEKQSIGQYGFIALVFDTEGNMIGLHSMQ